MIARRAGRCCAAAECRVGRDSTAWLGLPSECAQVMAMRPGSALPVELRTVFKGCALLADDKTSKPPPLMDLVRRECGSPGRFIERFAGVYELSS